jgi:hypothetical protein
MRHACSRCFGFWFFIAQFAFDLNCHPFRHIVLYFSPLSVDGCEAGMPHLQAAAARFAFTRGLGDLQPSIYKPRCRCVLQEGEQTPPVQQTAPCLRLLNRRVDAIFKMCGAFICFVRRRQLLPSDRAAAAERSCCCLTPEVIS